MPDKPAPPYILARDECAAGFTGPDWVPFNLWMQHEYSTGEALERECATKLIFHPAAKKLWQAIAKEYAGHGQANGIASELPRRCAQILRHWRAIPKTTIAEFREARDSLSRHAKQLSLELQRFFERHGPENEGTINFTQLLTEDEQTEMMERIQRHNHYLVNRGLRPAERVSYEEYISRHEVNGEWIDPPQKCSADTGETFSLLLGGDGTPGEVFDGIVPDLPSMLARISSLFSDDGSHPPLQRPHGKNTDRNYFLRSLIRYFLVSYGRMSPSIVATITSIFFSQGVSDNEVAKQIDYLPDGRHMPWRR